jgi:hypothetical protein
MNWRLRLRHWVLIARLATMALILAAIVGLIYTFHPQPGLEAPPPPGLVGTASAGSCGRISALLLEPPNAVVANETFQIQVRISVSGRDFPDCKISSGISFLDPLIEVLPARAREVLASDMQTLSWTAKATAPEETALSVQIVLASLEPYGSSASVELTKKIEVLHGGRSALSQIALNSYADAMSSAVTTSGTRFKAGHSYVTQLVVSGASQVAPPGLDPQVTVKVCVQPSPAIVTTASGADHCIVKTGDLRQPFSLPMAIELRPSEPGPIYLLASVTIQGENDGVPLHDAEKEFTNEAGSVHQTIAQKLASAADAVNKWLVAVGGAAGLAIVISSVQVLRHRRRSQPARHGQA